jgi:hypothetical protein
VYQHRLLALLTNLEHAAAKRVEALLNLGVCQVDKVDASSRLSPLALGYNERTGSKVELAVSLHAGIITVVAAIA